MKRLVLLGCLFAGCMSISETEDESCCPFEATATVTNDYIRVAVINRSKCDMLIRVSDGKEAPPRAYTIAWTSGKYQTPMMKASVLDSDDCHWRPLTVTSADQTSFKSDAIHIFRIPFPDNFRHLISLNFFLTGSRWPDLSETQGYRSFYKSAKTYEIHAKIRDERSESRQILDKLHKTVLPARRFERERLSAVLIAEYEASCARVGDNLFQVLFHSPYKSATLDNPLQWWRGYLDISTFATLFGNKDADPIVTLSVPSLSIYETFQWIAEHTGMAVFYYPDTFFFTHKDKEKFE